MENKLTKKCSYNYQIYFFLIILPLIFFSCSSKAKTVRNTARAKVNNIKNVSKDINYTSLEKEVKSLRVLLGIAQSKRSLLKEVQKIINNNSELKNTITILEENSNNNYGGSTFPETDVVENLKIAVSKTEDKIIKLVANITRNMDKNIDKKNKNFKKNELDSIEEINLEKTDITPWKDNKSNEIIEKLWLAVYSVEDEIKALENQNTNIPIITSSQTLKEDKNNIKTQQNIIVEKNEIIEVNKKKESDGWTDLLDMIDSIDSESVENNQEEEEEEEIPNSTYVDTLKNPPEKPVFPQIIDKGLETKNKEVNNNPIKIFTETDLPKRNAKNRIVQRPNNHQKDTEDLIKTLENEIENSPKDLTEDQSDDKIKININLLKMYEYPTSKSEIIAKIYKNGQYSIIDTVNTFDSDFSYFLIRLNNGKTGWISEEENSLEESKKAVINTPKSNNIMVKENYEVVKTVPYKITINKNLLKLYRAPTTNSNVVARIYKGGNYPVLDYSKPEGFSNYFYKIKLKNGKKGWIFEKENISSSE